MPNDPYKKMQEFPIKPTVLSIRLQEIVSLISPSPRVIDVGTDHGQVPSYLLENHLTQRIVATDIHRDPAETARKYLMRQGVMKYSEVIQTDGLHGIVLDKEDTVILSGLGGLEMIRILTESLKEHQDRFPAGVNILMQPQRSAEELRNYLQNNGFVILKERICIDRDKIYVIILTEYQGESLPALSLISSILGPKILADRPEYTMQYLQHERNVLRKHMRARPELSEVIAYIEDVLQEAKG